MAPRRPKAFQKRQFEPEVIVTCVRWYFRFSLSLRDVEDLMAERGLSTDHATIWRWTQVYGPEVHRRLRGDVKRKSSTWHVDETFVRIAGRWMCLFRAVDSSGQTVDFYLSGAIRPRFANCSASATCIEDVVSGPGDTATTESSPTTATSNGACVRCKGREQ